MKKHLWPTLTLTFFTALGNAQDGAVPSPAANGYGVQGNVAWTKSRQDAEQERAILAARQKKAMMESMASTGMTTPTFTSAEQYLDHFRVSAVKHAEANGGPSAQRQVDYVPEFDSGPVLTGQGQPEPSLTVSQPSPPPPAAELPAKRGLFGFLKGREESPIEADLLPPPPAANYPEVPVAPVSVPPPMENRDAVAMATTGSEEKPSLLGRLFGKNKLTEPSFVPEPTLSAPSAPEPAAPEMTPPPVESVERVDIPSPPGFSAPPAPRPAPKPEVPAPADNPNPAPPALADKPKPADPEPAPAAKPAAPAPAPDASIFVNRPSSVTMGSATVMEEVQASVGGVLVRLYEGNRVELLDRQGSLAKIRLPDGREGTVSANSLGQ